MDNLNLNPDLFQILLHAGIALLLIVLTFTLGIKYGYNKMYHEKNPKQITHKMFALSLLISFFVGTGFSYYMLSKSVSYKVERAYEQGVEFGYETKELKAGETCEELLQKINDLLNKNKDTLNGYLFTR